MSLPGPGLHPGPFHMHSHTAASGRPCRLPPLSSCTRGLSRLIRSIFLVGPMGAGKTAVGRQLAGQLGLGFVDTDAEIETRTGVDIAYIFEREGEAGFRVRERNVIDEMTQLPGIVLATGGGAILLPENREHLAARGTVVFLDASIEQQMQRTRRSGRRPLLATDDPRAKLMELMRIRDPLYRAIAAITVRTDGRRLGAVAAEIATAISACSAST